MISLIITLAKSIYLAGVSDNGARKIKTTKRSIMSQREIFIHSQTIFRYMLTKTDILEHIKMGID